MSEIPKISAADLESVAQRKEAEGPALDVAGLAAQANAKIDSRRSALQELSDTFSQRLRSEIVFYMKNSPQRFESDENKGLGAQEFEAYRSAMLSKVQSLVEQYAPTEVEIAAKKEAQKKLQEAKNAAKEVKNVELGDIKEDPGPIKDVRALSEKYDTYEGWNESLQSQAGKVMAGAGKFQRQFQEFARAREGLHSYRRLLDYFATGDPETQDLEARKEGMERDMEAVKKKLEDGQKKLEKYGAKLREASNQQKEEKIAERDAHLKRIKESEGTGQKAKKEREVQYNRLKEQRDTLTGERKKLAEYGEKVATTKSERGKEIEFAKERQGQLGDFDGRLRNASLEIEKLLLDPNLPEAQRALLEQTQETLSGKADKIRFAQTGASAVINQNMDEWNRLSEEERKTGLASYNIDTHLTQDVEPTIATLDQHIGTLDSAMIQYSDSKEEVMKYYGEAFKTYDEIDGAVDNAVLSHNLANTQIIESMGDQIRGFHSMSIDKPSGVTGFLDATLGTVLNTVGSGLTETGGWLVKQAIDLDKDLSLAKQNGLHPAWYWSGKVLVEVVGVPIGVAGGLVEMGGGIATAVGSPLNTLNGMGALIGRNPTTGEWSAGTAGNSWLGLGKALIQYEHFSEGRIGVGIGKIFPDVVLALTGAGAAAKGAQAALKAAKAARLAGTTTSRMLRVAATEFGAVTGREIVVSARQAVSTARAIPGAVASAVRGAPNLARGAVEAVRGFGRRVATQGVEVAEDAGQSERILARRKLAEEGALERPGQALDDIGGHYEQYVARYDEVAARLGAKADEASIARAMASEFPELAETARLVERTNPALAQRIRGQREGIAKVNAMLREDELPKVIKKIMDEVMDGRAPLTKELFESILEHPTISKDLLTAFDRFPDMMLDWRLGSKENLLTRLAERIRIFDDVDVVYQTLRGMDNAEAAQLLERSLARASESMPVVPTQKFAKTLERLKKRDPEAFEMLRNTDATTIIESDCLEAVIRGNKVESVGRSGPVTIYIGKRHLGTGGFGNVDLVLYARKGDKKFTRAAYKRANDTDSARRGLVGEVNDAKIVQQIDDPNVIRILDTGENSDWILSETGSEAMDMHAMLSRVMPDEVFGFYDGVINGVEAIWRKGYFHGDLKPPNFLTFIQDGKRVVKIIDHTPSPMSRMIQRNHTEGFAFTREEVIEAAQKLLARNMPHDQIQTWISKAQDVRALVKSINGSLGALVDTSDIDKLVARLNQDQISLLERASDIAERGEDILHAGDPSFLLEVRKLARDLESEFAKCKADPTRPSFAAHGPGAKAPSPPKTEDIPASQFITDEPPAIPPPPPLPRRAPPPPPPRPGAIGA